MPAETIEPRQLSDAERSQLRTQLTTKSESLKSRSIGFKVRGQPMKDGAPVARIPSSLADAEASVCGVKGFMVDEVREFQTSDGGTEVVDCAHVAALDIVDSPVHVHGVTHEIYQVLSGKGKMILDDEVIEVEAGSVIVLPPGVVHGVASNDPNVPVKVLLSFSLGLAPKSKPEFRDEAILWERASGRIEEIRAQARKAVEVIQA